MEINERIHRWRKARGKTLQDIADKLDVTRSAVSYWETGTNVPQQKNLEALVEALGLTMVEFYGPIPKPRKRAKAA